MLAKTYHYNNFDFSSVSNETLNIIVIGILVGIIVGTVCSVIYKTFTYSFINALIKKDALSKEKAVKINDLDFIGKWYIENELKYAYKTLRRYVICVNEEELLSSTTQGKKKDFQEENYQHL